MSDIKLAMASLATNRTGGSYFRIGESAAHEDLSGKDYEGRWRIDKNTDTSPYCKLVVANGGQEKASIEITPEGDVTITTLEQLTANVEGETNITTPKATITGDVDITGSVNLNPYLHDGTEHKRLIPQRFKKYPLNLGVKLRFFNSTVKPV